MMQSKLQSYDYDRTQGAASMSLPGVMTDHIVIGVEVANRRIADLVNGCERGSCAGLAGLRRLLST